MPSRNRNPKIIREQYELDNIIERYLISTYPKIFPKENPEQFKQLQKELNMKNKQTISKFLMKSLQLLLVIKMLRFDSPHSLTQYQNQDTLRKVVT